MDGHGLLGASAKVIASHCRSPSTILAGGMPYDGKTWGAATDLGVVLRVLPALFLLSHAWAMHEQVRCQVCHAYNINAENQVAKALRAPGTALCLSCHDAGQDITTLNPPHVMNGRKELAGGAFSAAPDSDNTGRNRVAIDATLDLTPPGGASMDDFNCLSGRDAHGNGNYRNPRSEINGRPFLVSAEGDPNLQHNLYLSGMTDF